MKTQQTAFIQDALTDLFHSSPESFLSLLNRDGTRFLRFYWDKVGEKFPPEQRRDSFGLNYVIRQPRASTTIGLITLPAPQVPGEAHYAAVVYRPHRRLLLVSDTTAFFALEALGEDEGLPRAELVEWTRRLERVKLKTLAVRGLEDFYNQVFEEVREDYP